MAKLTTLIFFFFFFFFFLLSLTSLPLSFYAAAAKAKSEKSKVQGPQFKPATFKPSLYQYCKSQMLKFNKKNPEALTEACLKVKVLPGCESHLGQRIFHYDKLAKNPKRAKRILTMALTHGDEAASGTVARTWMERLENIDSRNSWRVIPIVNPDGWDKKTRMNARGVDINRNFPTKDWSKQALKRWKKDKKSDPRRYPGTKGGSEPETQCVVNHIEDFKPDFIISIHTPYGILDFDGPKKIRFPSFKPLPWISLGHYPGSLGRYMWKEREVPVLTIELKGQKSLSRLEEFDRLQDISGTVAIQSDRFLKKQVKKKEKNRKKDNKFSQN